MQFNPHLSSLCQSRNQTTPLNANIGIWSQSSAKSDMCRLPALPSTRYTTLRCYESLDWLGCFLLGDNFTLIHAEHYITGTFPIIDEEL